MPVFIELTTEPFEQNFQRLKDRHDPSLSRSGRAGLVNVRRPLRGLEIKEDTYASFKVLRSNGSEVPFTDSSDASGTSTSYSNFILQSVQEQRMEKHQIIETFGDTYLYFFGAAPQFLDVAAILINSNDFNWEAEWWANWDNVLRGSKSVENGARTYLFYDDNVVEGYMLMSQAQKISSEPFMVQMNFRMFVSSIRNVSNIGDPSFPVQASVYLPPDVSLTKGDAFNRLTNYLEANDEGMRPGQAKSWMDEVIRASDPRQFGTGARMVDLLRRGTRSIAFPSDVQAYLDQDDPTLGVRNVLGMYDDHPVRSLIADNRDEYTGFSGSDPFLNNQLPEVYDQRVRSIVEVEDLFKEAISWMGCFGANINSYQLMSGIGLGVSFGAGAGVGIGFGAGAGVGAKATFGAVTRGKIGVEASAKVFAGFGFGSNYRPGTAANGFGQAGVLPNMYSPGQLGAQQADVMFAGAGWTAGQGLQTAYGDMNYGYPSPYGGPGYGRVGYGDNGGPSYGLSFGANGDPGYLPPSSFTQAGVADIRSDLDRLRRGSYGFGSGIGGIGAGSSFAGVGAGASVSIGGAVSAFALSVVPGTLNPNGNALTATGRRMGLAERNPYGVPCLGKTGQRPVNLLNLL